MSSCTPDGRAHSDPDPTTGTAVDDQPAAHGDIGQDQHILSHQSQHAYEYNSTSTPWHSSASATAYPQYDATQNASSVSFDPLGMTDLRYALPNHSSSHVSSSYPVPQTVGPSFAPGSVAPEAHAFLDAQQSETHQSYQHHHNYDSQHIGRGIVLARGVRGHISSFAPRGRGQHFDPSYSRIWRGPFQTGDTSFPAPRNQRQSEPTTSLQKFRGPPRKPRQSGYALWVGNLAPGTAILDVTNHFSRNATTDIESVFLMSKSNCAFVNYRTEASCVAAMKRFHESRLLGMRLICYVRRGTVAGQPTQDSAARLGPRSDASDSDPQATRSAGTGAKEADAVQPDSTDEQGPFDGVKENDPGHTRSSASPDHSLAVPDKYFILKSLAIYDLEASVRDGTWATQTHNERVLNDAFQTAENVYLIFSANKSGEFFGYARMLSRISVGHANSDPNTRSETVKASEEQASLPTPPGRYAPKGRMFDDPARGTSFWEADRLSEPQDNSNFQDDGSSHEQVTEASTDGISGRDKAFRVGWICTERLPFHRTRGLRNSWNANKEVKIARDGVELEPTVGSRLLQMFHKPVGMALHQQQGPLVPQGIHQQPVIATSSPNPGWGRGGHSQDQSRTTR